jgi:hypothetical protein
MIFFNNKVKYFHKTIFKHLLNWNSIGKQFRQSRHLSAKTSTHFLGLNTFNSIIISKMKINFF